MVVTQLKLLWNSNEQEAKTNEPQIINDNKIENLNKEKEEQETDSKASESPKKKKMKKKIVNPIVFNCLCKD